LRPAETAAATERRPVLPELEAKCSRLIGLCDLDLASTWFDGVADEQTWDTESLSHHRAYPEANQLAHERLQAEDAARTVKELEARDPLSPEQKKRVKELSAVVRDCEAQKEQIRSSTADLEVRSSLVLSCRCAKSLSLSPLSLSLSLSLSLGALLKRY